MKAKQSNEEASIDRQAAIARLRKSREAFLSGLTERGQKYGAKWAAESASYEELIRLGELRHVEPNDFRKSLSAECGHSPAWGFVAIIWPGRDDPGTVDEFWSSILCDELCDDRRELADDPFFVRAFADAAVDFFEDVSGELG